ncbi:MAG: hypothetical protein JXQ87_15885 [Bacteroidia bacterium]
MPKTDINEFQRPYDQVFIWALVIFLLNLTLKGLFLEYPDFGHDEPFTLFRVQKTYSELIADLAANNHPPLFESIMWVWLRITGYSPTLLRIVPLLLSSATAVALFWFGRKHFSLFVGVFSALLFTFSDYHFYLSHEIRSYPLFAFLTVLSFDIYLRLSDKSIENKESDSKRKSKILLAALIITNTLLLYTHYFSATIIAAQFLHALFIFRNRNLIFKVIASLVSVSILYLPQIISVKSRLIDKVEGGHWLAAPGFEELFNVLRKFFNAPAIVILALALILVSFWLTRKSQFFKKQLAIGLLFPGVYIGMWVLAQETPVFQDRYISFTTIGAFILCAITFEQLPKLTRLPSSIILLGIMALLVNYKPSNKQWVPELVEIIESEKTENTTVYIYPSWSLQCFSYHYNLEFFKDYQKTRSLLANENIILGNKKSVGDFISKSKETEKFIIINFEGPISELAKDYGHLNPKVIEKDRHGVMVVKRNK